MVLSKLVSNEQTIINEIKAFSLKPAIRINKINIPINTNKRGIILI